MSTTNIVFYVITSIALTISLFKDISKTKQALIKAWKSFENILPQLLVVLMIIGLVLSILTPEQISALIGAESGVIGILLALSIGSITLIPGFVAFPLAAALLNNGAGLTQIAAFISSLMMVGVVTLPMEIKFFGKRAAYTRNGLAVIFSLIVALLMGILL
ncbi:MAG: hypothetical protein VB009_07685 [Erysipelotrichaceae bacterium]|nr:hypothetical protein [Erysipelotrichaceae bacterium]